MLGTLVLLAVMVSIGVGTSCSTCHKITAGLPSLFSPRETERESEREVAGKLCYSLCTFFFTPKKKTQLDLRLRGSGIGDA
jgi:hypothetical protein